PRSRERDPAGGLAVVPGARRAAAAAVLGTDDLRGEGLHVLLLLADRHSRHGIGGADLRDQPVRRRPARPAVARGSIVMTSISMPAPVAGEGSEPAGDVVLDVDGLDVDIATPDGTLHAVRDLTFQARRGETLCIVGESGC